MKTLAIYTFSLALLLFGAGRAEAQKKADKDAAYKEMQALIESGSYLFQVQSINPSGGNSIRPTTIYTMEADEGRFKAFLPYFGRAYQSSYGGDGGVEFDGEAENLEISGNEKKRHVTVKFDIRGVTDRYNIIFSVGHGGYGTLSITCQKRQPISYYGSVQALPAK